jgi:hypothetical protein
MGLFFSPRYFARNISMSSNASLKAAPGALSHATQLKLHGAGGALQPGRQTRRVRQLESQVQEQIERALRSRGYWVLSTSEHRKRQACPNCNHRFTPTGGRGCDKGVPDLLVTSGRSRPIQWPPGVWLGLECKGPTTPLSPEQKLLHAERRIFIVRSVETALRLVRDFELSLIG